MPRHSSRRRNDEQASASSRQRTPHFAHAVLENSSGRAPGSGGGGRPGRCGTRGTGRAPSPAPRGVGPRRHRRAYIAPAFRTSASAAASRPSTTWSRARRPVSVATIRPRSVRSRTAPSRVAQPPQAVSRIAPITRRPPSRCRCRSSRRSPPQWRSPPRLQRTRQRPPLLLPPPRLLLQPPLRQPLRHPQPPQPRPPPRQHPQPRLPRSPPPSLLPPLPPLAHLLRSPRLPPRTQPPPRRLSLRSPWARRPAAQSRRPQRFRRYPPARWPAVRSRRRPHRPRSHRRRHR